MPAYNEREGVGQTVRAFLNHPYVDEVIVADNNSTDGTYEIAQEAGARVVRESRQGYGYACRTAIETAKGDLIILTESDNSFYAEDLNLLFAYIPYFDMVKSARSNHHLISDDADWTISLMLGNWIVAKYMQLLYFGFKFTQDMHMREMGGTYRVIKRAAYELIKPHLTEGQGAFLADMTSIAIKKNLKVLEIPIRYRGRLGVSKITGSRWRATLLGLRMIWIITRNRYKVLED